VESTTEPTEGLGELGEGMARTLRRDPCTTKNDDGGVVYLTAEFKALRAKQLATQTGKIIL
jgi:hypothetical protein